MAATHLSVPPWTGKALGAAAALVFAPPQPGSLVWWLTAGLALGHGFDSLGSHFGARPAPAAPPPEDARASLRYTFAALGRIAATGDGGSESLGLAESLMTRLAFLPERRREALAWFEAGRDPAFPFHTLAEACRDTFGEHPVLQGLARRTLCRMAALIDTPAAARELLALGARLGWDRQQLVDDALGERHAGETDPTVRARRTLGVQPD